MDAISPFLTSYQIINLGSFSRGILERPKLAFRFHEASVGAIKIVLIHEILKELPITVRFTIKSKFNFIWA